MRIDAHQHFWRLDRGDYGWLTPALGPIHRDFGPDDLAPLLARHGIEGTVLVQAAPTLAETGYLLEIAAVTPFVLGVVGWVDAEAGASDIAKLAAEPKLKGLRPMIQDIADPGWMLGAGLEPFWAGLEEAGLVFDALVLPGHLENLLTLLARHPGLRTVIDHGAKPRIASGDFDGWAEAMARLAGETDAFCKLSGLVTEAGPDWTPERLAPYVAHLLKVFGPERLVWGSDWPVCTLAATYDRWLETTDALLAGLGPEAGAAVLGGNARVLYRL